MNNQTRIYKQTRLVEQIDPNERLLGWIDSQSQIVRSDGVVVGRIDPQQTVLRRTSHDEREVGSFNQEGHIHSHGLFEGGLLGWVDADGIVTRAGLIFGEEDVGRVEGGQQAAGAAALLLIFLPEENEEEKRMRR